MNNAFDKRADDYFSVLATPRRHSRAVHKRIEVRPQTKLKPAICFILAAVFICAAIAASADTPIARYVDFFGQYLKEDSSAQMNAWTENEVIALLENMQGELPGVDKPSAPETIMREHFADNTFVYKDEAMKSILETMFGPMNRWSLEDKNSYQQMLVEYGLLDEVIQLLPAESDMTVEEVKRLSIRFLSDQYDISPEKLAQYAVYVSLQKVTGLPPLEKEWGLSFESDNPHDDDYVIYVTPDGQYRGSEVYPSEENASAEAYLDRLFREKGFFEYWTPEEKCRFANDFKLKYATDTLEGAYSGAIASVDFLLPDSQYLSESHAKSIGYSAVKEAFGYTDDAMENYENVSASLLVLTGDAMPVWRIVFWPNYAQTAPADIAICAVEMDAESGLLVHVRINSEEKPLSLRDLI